MVTADEMLCEGCGEVFCRCHELAECELCLRRLRSDDVFELGGKVLCEDDFGTELRKLRARESNRRRTVAA